MTLTCLSCGVHRGKEESLEMNARVRRACEGRCRGETVHIAGLPVGYVYLTTVEVLGKTRRGEREERERERKLM